MLDGWQDVDGMTLEQEIDVIQTHVQTLPEAATIVVLGTCQGRLEVAIGLVCRGTQRKVYGVDNFDQANPGYVRPSLEVSLENVAGHGLRPWVEILVGDTVEVAYSWYRGPIHLLIHDASHERAKVEADLRAWLPHLASGAHVYLHDYYPPGEGLEGVREAAQAVLGEPFFVGYRLGCYETK